MKNYAAFACAVIAILGCSEQSGSVPTLGSIKPGLYDSLPPGVAKVSGSCSGKLAMTPSNYAEAGFKNNYPLVYHCDKKKFEVLSAESALEPGSSYGTFR